MATRGDAQSLFDTLADSLSEVVPLSEGATLFDAQAMVDNACGQSRRGGGVVRR